MSRRLGASEGHGAVKWRTLGVSIRLGSLLLVYFLLSAPSALVAGSEGQRTATICLIAEDFTASGSPPASSTQPKVDPWVRLAHERLSLLLGPSGPAALNARAGFGSSTTGESVLLRYILTDLRRGRNPMARTVLSRFEEEEFAQLLAPGGANVIGRAALRSAFGRAAEEVDRAARQSASRPAPRQTVASSVEDLEDMKRARRLWAEADELERTAAAGNLDINRFNARMDEAIQKRRQAKELRQKAEGQFAQRSGGAAGQLEVQAGSVGAGIAGEAATSRESIFRRDDAAASSAPTVGALEQMLRNEIDREVQSVIGEYWSLATESFTGRFNWSAAATEGFKKAADEFVGLGGGTVVTHSYEVVLEASNMVGDPNSTEEELRAKLMEAEVGIIAAETPKDILLWSVHAARRRADFLDSLDKPFASQAADFLRDWASETVLKMNVMEDPVLKPLTQAHLNKLNSMQAGWVEHKPGICMAGGPPPICPKSHWYLDRRAAAISRQVYLDELRLQGYNISSVK